MFSEVFKDAAASQKAWLSRARRVQFHGKDKGWLSHDGKPLDKEVQAAMDRLKSPIPPGWSNVHVNTDPKSAMVAKGMDSKGRWQRLYSKEHSASASVDKFARVVQLQPHISKLFDQSAKDMMDAKKTDRERDAAATVNLVLKTGFRPGSTKDTGAEEQAYGASTLEKRHVKVKGHNITFTFTGKHAVEQEKTLVDPELAGYLGGKLKTLKSNDKVFKASGETAGNYLKTVTGNSAFKVKDLRTWNGTTLATHLLKDEADPVSEKALKDLKTRVSTAVSEHLGNTPAMALNSYINPMVWPEVTKNLKPLKKAK